MSRSSISLLGAVCLLGALPLMAQAAESDLFSMPSPLGTQLRHDGFSMQRIKAGPEASSKSSPSTLFGPDVLPKWQPNSGGDATERLQGGRFEFR